MGLSVYPKDENSRVFNMIAPDFLQMALQATDRGGDPMDMAAAQAWAVERLGDVKASGGKDEVLLPGEIRWRTYRDNLANGISIPETVCAQLAKCAAPHGLVLPWEDA